MTPPSRGARSADSEILRSYSEALRTLRTSGGRPLALRPNGKRQADGAAAGHLPRPGARRSARATPKCSEAAPKSHRAPSGGAPGRRGQAPRGRRHSLGRGPTRSDKVRQRSDTARRSARRKPGAAPSIAKYRQLSPGAACAARLRRDGKTFAGRGHGTRGEAAPSQVSPSIARAPHLEDGTMAAPGRPLSSGAPTPAQAPRGLSRRSAARKGPAKSLHSPRARGRWRERPGAFSQAP